MSSSSAASRKRPRSTPPPVPDDPFAPGGLYDFLPPPDPEKDAAAKVAAEQKTRKRAQLPEEDRTKVIFLDIDGVLLAAGSVETIFIDGVALPVRSHMSEGDFSASALGALRKIVEKTGASVVLSSEWRRTESMRESIRGILKGQEMPPFRDYNPVFQPRPDLKDHDKAIQWCERRAREIGQFLKNNKEVASWVALDDLDFYWADSVRAVGTPVIKCRSVLTNAQHCLTEEDAEKAVQILENPPNPTEEEIEIAQAEAVRFTRNALENAGANGIKMG